MDYELALELKKAGFPNIFLVCDNTDPQHHDCRADRTDCVMKALNTPTLPELINACGDNFLELTIYKYKKSHSKRGMWYAFTRSVNFWKTLRNKLFRTQPVSYIAGDTNEDGWQWIHRGEGTSAEEAVARLYLAIHKK